MLTAQCGSSYKTKSGAEQQECSIAVEMPCNKQGVDKELNGADEEFNSAETSHLL